MSDDPILSATTVSGLMKALDEVYGWTLPTTFPEGTPLGTLWAVPISVQRNAKADVLYLATATSPYAIAAILSGTVEAEVVTDANP